MSTNSISAQGSSMPPPSEQSFPLMDFPDEVLLKIIHEVNNPQTLLRTAGSNRRLRRLVNDEVSISRLVEIAKDNGVRKKSKANANHFPVCPPAPKSVRRARSRFA